MPYAKIIEWTSHTKADIPLDGKAYRHALQSEDEVTFAFWWEEGDHGLDVLKSVGEQTGEDILELLDRVSVVTWTIMASVTIHIARRDVHRDVYAYRGHAAIAEIDSDTLAYLTLKHPGLVWSDTDGHCDWEWATGD